MILRDIQEIEITRVSQDFKRQENGFPKVFKIQQSSKFKRSKAPVAADTLDDQPMQHSSKTLTQSDLSVPASHQPMQPEDQPRDKTFLLSGELSTIDSVQESKSLKELLDYTRSSSSQIQKRAWGIILKIFKKHKSRETVVKEIEKVDLGLYLRVGLDRKEVDDVLEILEILMVDHDQVQLETVLFSRNFMVKLGSSQFLLQKNIYKSKDQAYKTSKAQDENSAETFGSIKILLKNEPIMGLLEGNIMTRLVYLLNSDLEMWNTIRILEIILAFSRYSKKSTKFIKGSLETILKFSRCDETRHLTFHIFLNFIAASRENAVEFVRINGLDVIMASIADLQDSDTNVAWMILAICGRYGLTAGILSDYRPMFYAKAREYFAFSNDEFHLKSRIGLLKCLSHFIFMVPKGFVMGSLEDEMKPFLDILMSTLSWMTDLEKFKENVFHLHFASISAAVDIFTAYLSRLNPSASTSDLCSRIHIQIQSLLPRFRKKALEFAFTEISYVDETPFKSWDLQKMPRSLSHMIINLTYQTFGIDFFTSILDLMSIITPWTDETLDIESDLRCIVDHILEQPMTYWTRFYSQAQTSLLTSYMKSFEKILSEKLKFRIYFHLLSSLQPGQEIICSRTLFSLFKLLDSSPLNHISTIPSEHKMVMLDIYDKSFYTDSNLKNSSALYNHDYESITSQWMEIEENGPTLPLSQFWVYSPIESFLEEEKNQVTICGEDLGGYIFIIYSLISLYDSCGFGLDVGRLIIATMKICLLSSSTDEAICLEPKIQECIAYVLNLWNSASTINLERLMGSEVNFYQLYSQLLSNFSSSSFGNELWGRLLLIPLHNMYPCDYKSLFFSSLEPKILGLITAPKPANSEDYIISKADHEALKIFKKLITSKRITEDKNPFLYFILTAEQK